MTPFDGSKSTDDIRYGAKSLDDVATEFDRLASVARDEAAGAFRRGSRSVGALNREALVWEEAAAICRRTYFIVADGTDAKVAAGALAYADTVEGDRLAIVKAFADGALDRPFQIRIIAAATPSGLAVEDITAMKAYQAGKDFSK